jgi:hypothetical protein
MNLLHFDFNDKNLEQISKTQIEARTYKDIRNLCENKKYSFVGPQVLYNDVLRALQAERWTTSIVQLYLNLSCKKLQRL